MSTFEVKVYKLSIEPHPNADSIELARVGDYLSVVRRGVFQNGDLAVYIPEQAIVPDTLLEEMGLGGKLAGSKKNRVRAISLRGVLSQGVIYPNNGWSEGQDVAIELGITKWEPPIPTTLAGEVNVWDGKFTFDVENIKKFPNVFQDGEDVVITEKIHGSCLICILVPEPLRKPDMIDGKFVVISKGLATNRLYFKDNEKNQGNSYVKTVKENGLLGKLEKNFGYCPEPVVVVGELIGVQDMKYGVEGGKLTFRAFGLKVGATWWDFEKMAMLMNLLKIPVVPILYAGPFSKGVLEQYTNGKESVTGKSLHIREGVVIYPKAERNDPVIGRVFLKSVSEAYLLRKEGTEFT